MTRYMTSYTLGLSLQSERLRPPVEYKSHAGRIACKFL